MAVSIDRVYQKVLAFANKEQRGYITPQEFNLFADQAQMEIFEQYFYDINQWNRQHGNSHEYSDMLVNLEEKIDKFSHIALGDNVTVFNQYGDINLDDDLPDLYRLGSVRVKYPENTNYITAEVIKSRQEFTLYNSSPLTGEFRGANAKQSTKRPIYHRHTTPNGRDRIKIYPHPVEDDGSPIDLSTNEVNLALPHATVSSVTHPLAYTSVGQYMFFNADFLSHVPAIGTTIGFPPGPYTLTVVRDGAVIFTGDLAIWGADNTNSISMGPNIAHARRSPNPGAVNGAGDWEIGDTIYLANTDIYEDNMRNVQIDYIRKPTTPNWGYVVINDKALYNSTSSTDFQLHLSEESELVYRILAFAGVAIEKPQLTQVAAGLEQAKVQQEKQ